MAITCQICGFKANNSLQVHINNVHGLINKEYLEKYPESRIYSRAYGERLRYTNTHRDPSYKKVISDKIINNWKDPEKREKFCKALKESKSKPEVRKNLSRSLKRYFENRTPEQTEFHRQGIIESWKDPIKRNNRLKAIRKAHSSQETRNKHSIALKKYLHGLTEEEKELRKENLRKIWAKPDNRKKILELSKIGIEKARSPEGQENLKKANFRPEVIAKRSANAKKNLIKMMSSREGSALNKFLKKQLNEIKIYPEKEYHIGPFYVDFCFPDKKIVIEADGDWWHANPEYMKKRKIATLHPLQQRVVDKDKRENFYLIHRGWKILRFWEYDIYNKTEECLSIIKGALCQ